MATELELKRLAFIKYLYELAVEQSLKPEPLAQVSILTFHDSAELFLELAAEHLQVSNKIGEFMEYWEKLKPKLKGQELTQKRAMERLNKSRVDLKHHGITPSKSVIEEFRVTTANFFKDNIQLVFAKDFDTISLIDLVSDRAAKQELEQAQVLMQQGKIGSALQRISIAFDKVLEGFKADRDSMYGPSPFYFGETLDAYRSYNMGIKEKKLGEFIDRTGSVIHYLQDAIKMLSLGIDYRKYKRFRIYAHTLSRDASGNHVLYEPEPQDEKEYSLEDCQYCFNFVIETAIHLQEFDFEYDWEAHHERHQGE